MKFERRFQTERDSPPQVIFQVGALRRERGGGFFQTVADEIAAEAIAMLCIACTGSRQGCN